MQSAAVEEGDPLTAEEEELVDELFQLVKKFPNGIVADQLRKEFHKRLGHF